MKHFFTLALIAGALLLSAPSQARMVATKAQCVAACDGNGTSGETCNLVAFRYPPRQQGRKYKVCRNKLIRQCRKWGTDAMCPVPPPTTTTTVPAPVVTTTTQPAPVVTTTTQPAPVVTTTTTPYIPPTTTTTLPSRAAFYEGEWQFTGSVTQNSCGSSITGLRDYVTVDVQIGGNIVGTIDSVPGLVLTGSFPNGNNDLGLEGTYYDSGCSADIAMLFLYGADGSLLDGAWGMDVTCGYNSCRVIWAGTWLRLS